MRLPSVEVHVSQNDPEEFLRFGTRKIVALSHLQQLQPVQEPDHTQEGQNVNISSDNEALTKQWDQDLERLCTNKKLNVSDDRKLY